MADLTPNASMAIEARRGLQWAEDGRAGDGLVPRTVTDARKMADREALSEEKVRRMPAWFARHSVDMEAPANADPGNEGYPGPGRVAWALWGGDAGRSWAERKVQQLNAEQERSVKVEIEIGEDDSDKEEIIAEHPGLTERQAALYSAYEKSAEEYGLFNTGIGPDGAHYIAENPFYESEGIGCKACAFYQPSAEVEGQGNCKIVAGPAELEGRVAAEAVCKLWIVPAPGQQTSPQVDGEEEMPPMETEALGIERVKVRLEELRVAASGDPDKKNELVVTGYAALFDSRSEDLGGFVEEIDRGAFADALKRSDLDVRFLINHDSNLVLARTRSGTLELTEDQRGLRIYARVAPYSYAEDLRIAIDRGDVDQMSFAFTTEQDSWGKTEDGMNLRRVERVKDLFDVSVVTYPAYPETKTEVLKRAVQRGAVAAPESSLAEVVPADERESSDTEVRTEQSPDQGAELSRLRELIRSRTK